jgi:hypothetical protein
MQVYSPPFMRRSPLDAEHHPPEANRHDAPQQHVPPHAQEAAHVGLLGVRSQVDHRHPGDQAGGLRAGILVGCGRSSASDEAPGIDQIDTAVLVVARVAGCHGGLSAAARSIGGAHSQALLDVVIEVADGDAGHGGAPVLEQHLDFDRCEAFSPMAGQRSDPRSCSASSRSAPRCCRSRIARPPDHPR